ncbi:uncharacterized protein LOC103959499 isoform X1 [Pyrus x bretschneideri]|uniref:uncharacterized protein LOC103959499 isoform X1 n=1 Tax=Pyrus x bretschneideri TaxID=225117 RepID=UPI00202EA4F2|nr:uncharacterized protein LOC103959499 isoform X1 [Pyrus x bretschneideri]
MKMAENGAFEGDHLAVTEGPGFSQLLFPADEVVNLAVDSDQTFNYTRPSTYPTQIKPPKILCFGNYDQTHGNGVEIGFLETAKKSAAACSESSSVSSTGTASINALPKSNNKRQRGSAPISSTATPPIQRAAKRAKSENPTSAGNGKVRPFNKNRTPKKEREAWRTNHSAAAARFTIRQDGHGIGASRSDGIHQISAGTGSGAVLALPSTPASFTCSWWRGETRRKKKRAEEPRTMPGPNGVHNACGEQQRCGLLVTGHGQHL